MRKFKARSQRHLTTRTLTEATVKAVRNIYWTVRKMPAGILVFLKKMFSIIEVASTTISNIAKLVFFGLLLIIVVGGAYWIIQDARENRVYLHPTTAPEDLKKQGYTDDVINRRIIESIDNITQIQPQFSRKKTSPLLTWATDDYAGISVGLSAPLGKGIKVSSSDRTLFDISNWIRNALGYATHHAYFEIVAKDNVYILLTRFDRKNIGVYKGNISDVDALLEQGASSIVSQYNPCGMISYLQTRNTLKNSRGVVKGCEKYIDDANRYWIDNVWGVYWQSQDNHEKAIEYFRRSISENSKFPLAHSNLGWSLHLRALRTKDRKLVEEAIAELKKSIDLDNNIAHVHVRLAMVFAIQGRRVEAQRHLDVAQKLNPDSKRRYFYLFAITDSKRAPYLWLKDEANRGNAEAKEHLMSAYMFGTFGAKKNLDEGFFWAVQAANSGSILAHYVLAASSVLSEKGLGDIAIVRKWLERAAQLGDGYSEMLLGLLDEHLDKIWIEEKHESISKGQINERYKKALNVLVGKVNDGDGVAELAIGLIYKLGLGVPVDKVEANAWFRKSRISFESVDQSIDPSGVFMLGATTALGLGTEPDMDRAIQYFNKAAKLAKALARTARNEMSANSAEAALNSMYVLLGELYSNGFLVEKDAERGVGWYKVAATGGDKTAAYNVGVAYFLGSGVPRDIEEAIRWLEVAARGGHPESMFKVGLIYQFGVGVNIDIDIAKSWYEKSAATGHAEAIAALKRLSDATQ